MSGDTLTGILVAVFSVGGAAVLTAVFKGINGWRAGAARTEARAIQNLERYRDDADWRAAVAEHRESFKSDLADYWRARAGNAEHVIRVQLSESSVPAHPPIPVYSPLTRPQKTAVEKVTDA